MPRPKKNTVATVEENTTDIVREDMETADEVTQAGEDIAPDEQNEAGTGDAAPVEAAAPSGPAPENELEALRRRVAELEAAARKTAAPADGVVELTFLASVSPNNVCSLGDYGSLNGVGGYLEIPRKEFGSKFMIPVVRSLLQDRSLIVCSGLSEEERKRYGVDYQEGELLDMSAFDRLLDMPPAELTKLFTKLCPEHKEFAATRFITAYEKGDNRVSREKIEPLNDISKEINPKGMFRPILEGMNKA